MYNSISVNEQLHQLFLHLQQTASHSTDMSHSTNKFVYVKRNFSYQSSTMLPDPVKVLVNPNFNKKVFVNPNFNVNVTNTSSAAIPKIHINPNVQNVKLGTEVNERKNVNVIHVNPNVLRNIPVSSNSKMTENCNKTITKSDLEKVNPRIISTRTKLVRSTAKNVSENKIRKRRLSVKSKFKIIKSSILEKPITNGKKIISKYKLVKPNMMEKRKKNPSVVNKFKLDNRNNTVLSSPKNKKYLYVNRFLSISDIARNSLLKQSKNKVCVVNIEGVLYKKTPNCLKRTSDSFKKINNLKKTQGNVICKSKYKLLNKSIQVNSMPNNRELTNSRILRRKSNIRKSILKMRVCNIPCPYYRKFGKCKGKENGKCCRKHDPDQIALCTKFLQGACVDEKCPLSHNVSPEKMPTCKFYLEGSCSRDDCPYLHVRINPKSDICKDFLEGFCKKAAECDKRHQFLCPDYEKHGNCLKQRCPYPHGRMVRKYSVFVKNKFAKKSSNEYKNKIKIQSGPVDEKIHSSKSVDNCEINIKSRYYIGQKNLEKEDKASTSNQNNCIDDKAANECGIKSRPKLGKLPSFIAFEDI